MGEGDQKALGERRAMISKEIVRLQPSTTERVRPGPGPMSSTTSSSWCSRSRSPGRRRRSPSVGSARRSSTSAAASSRRWQTALPRRRAGDRTQGEGVFVGDRSRAGRVGENVPARRQAHGHDGPRGRLSERFRRGAVPWTPARGAVRARRPRRRGRGRCGCRS